jgi:hypothetical protein
MVAPIDDLFGALAPAMAAPSAPRPSPLGSGFYGPPEASWRVPLPWGEGFYSVARSSITGMRDAGDGRTWLTLSAASEQILVGVRPGQLIGVMPSLRLLA